MSERLKNIDTTTEILATEIQGANASQVMTLQRQARVVRTCDFKVGYSHNGTTPLDLQVGVATQRISVVPDALERSIDDLGVVMPAMADASEMTKVTVDSQVESGFPRYAIAQQLLEEGVRTNPRVYVSRFDMFPTNENGPNLRAIEVNAKCPEAQGWTPELSRRITGKKTYGPMGLVAREVSKEMGRRVGVVVWSNDAVKGNEKPHIKKELELLKQEGGIDDYVIADPDQVEVEEDVIIVAGEKVDWIYRYFGPDDVLYATSTDPRKNGVTRPEIHSDLHGVDVQKHYGNNSMIPMIGYGVKVAGVMWQLLQEGHRGKAVVFPDAPSARLGFKGLFPTVYAGENQYTKADSVAKRILTPTYHLHDVDAVPSNAVLKMTNSSGGADVIVGHQDTEAVQRALAAYGNGVPAENKDRLAQWNTLTASLKQNPDAWVVQPQIRPGEFDLDDNIRSSADQVPYDFDPYVTMIGDNTYVGPIVVRYKGINTGDDNKRINVVQGGKFTVAVL